MAKDERIRPGPLLDFGEVSHHLRLGTRVDLGRQEIPVHRVIGSVGRAHEFDRTFQPRGLRLRRIIDQIAANEPNAADTPIQVYEVDQAYFVLDGHKRMALAVREGRVYIDADVTRFFSRFHLDGQTTIDAVRLTDEEMRFREETGLLAAVPEARFPLGDPDEYLDLKESVKAHSYDLSLQRGQLVPAVEAAKHWYEAVFRAALAVAHESGYDEMLSTCSDAELFVIMRHGNRGRFGPDWEMAQTVADRSVKNLSAAAGPRLVSPVTRLVRRRRPRAEVLPQEPEGHSAEQPD
jgi:hypothetical protein